MEKIKTFTSLNYEELRRHFDAMNPLSTHAKEEVEKEVAFTKAAMAEVKNKVAQYNLGPNPERAAIFNKIETILGQLNVHPRPPTYWNRTKEEALSYHLHNSHSTAEEFRSLVRDLWKTVKDDKVDKDLQEYRQKKLQYLTKRNGDVKVEGVERKKFETVDDLSGRVEGAGIDKSHVRAEAHTPPEGLRKEERNQQIFPIQDGSGKKFEGTQGKPTDVRAEERNYEGGRMQGSDDRVGGSYLGSEFSAGDDKKDHGDYQFHKMKQNEGFQKEGYTHPPADYHPPVDQGYQRDYGYYNNPNWMYPGKQQQAGYSYQPPDNLESGQRGTNMGAGV